MLDEKDLQAIAGLINASETRLTKKLEDSEKLLIDEIGLVQSYLEKQIAQVQKNLEELQQYYKITKLENDNTSLLLKMIEALQRDVEELKKKTA